MQLDKSESSSAWHMILVEKAERNLKKKKGKKKKKKKGARKDGSVFQPHRLELLIFSLVHLSPLSLLRVALVLIPTLSF